MPYRLKCDVCGQKSAPVENPSSLTPAESAATRGFRRLHRRRCYRANFQTVRPAAAVGAFGSDARPMKAVRKPHGHVERTGPYGELQTGDTLSCCHCGCHWEVRAGSGVQRGFCQQCMGYVCGGPDCHDCLPKEARLANLEAGRPLLTPLAPKVLVPGLVGGVDARQAVDLFHPRETPPDGRGPVDAAAGQARGDAGPEPGGREDAGVGVAPGGPGG